MNQQDSNLFQGSLRECDFASPDIRHDEIGGHHHAVKPINRPIVTRSANEAGVRSRHFGDHIGDVVFLEPESVGHRWHSHDCASYSPEKIRNHIRSLPSTPHNLKNAATVFSLVENSASVPCEGTKPTLAKQKFGRVLHELLSSRVRNDSMSSETVALRPKDTQPSPLGAYTTRAKPFSPPDLGPTGEPSDSSFYSDDLPPPSPWFTGRQATVWDVFVFFTAFLFVLVTGLSIAASIFFLFFGSF